MTTPPPRLALWLLARRVPARWREFVIGDLVEEFHKRAETSQADARRWFIRQALIALLGRFPPRPMSAVPGESRAKGDRMLSSFVIEIVKSARSLRRMPALALAIVAVLGLGIGSNTAIFSIVNTVLIRPLPYEAPDRLVRLFHVPPQAAFPGIARFSVSPANFYDWQRRARSFDGMAIYRLRQFTLTGNGPAESVLAGAVGAGFFRVVRAQPALGRVFRDDEDVEALGHVAIVSDAFWKNNLGGVSNVLGQTLRLDGEPYTIVGVMPAAFSINAWGVAGRPIWVPLAHSPQQRLVRDNHNELVVARLAPGVTLAQAQAEMNAISTSLEAEYPKDNAGWGATVIPLHELIVGDIRSSLWTLWGAVGLVLMIACANVANLLFARSLSRRKELAIRSALGASRARVFRQLITEACLLAVTGGVLGLGLARLGLKAGAALLADQLPRADELALDGRVLLFALTISILTGLLAGVMPAVRAGRTNLVDALKEGGRDEAAPGLRTRRVLIACEIALSLVVLMGAGLMMRTLVALRTTEAGFNPHQVLTLDVALPATKYDTPAKTFTFLETTLARLRAVPGVEAAGAIDDLPALSSGSVQPVVPQGHPELLPREQPTVAVREITPGYLRVMQIPVIRGRDIVASDRDVLLVSQAAAKLLWGEVNPIGQRARFPLMSKPLPFEREVVGIVGDVKQEGLTEPVSPTVYHYSLGRGMGQSTFVLRTSGPPESLEVSAAAVIRDLDPNQPVQRVRTMDRALDTMLTSQRLTGLLLGIFAAIALVLATVGIYSVLSQIGRARAREIGIRTALGASTGDVLRLVVREGLMPAAAGIGAGAVVAIGSASVMQTLVFGVTPSDPLTLTAVALLLAVVALAASIVPALRAARVDPLTVLRAN